MKGLHIGGHVTSHIPVQGEGTGSHIQVAADARPGGQGDRAASKQRIFTYATIQGDRAAARAHAATHLSGDRDRASRGVDTAGHRAIDIDRASDGKEIAPYSPVYGNGAAKA